ncbi:MAG: hypothetical protein PHR83_14195 [Paludibacter sp.]|nr:hypothetical protein [Paludibacter sp.]
MKKSIIAIAVLFSCTYTIAQTEFDALKYVQTDINGTARYIGMAGAFGALGGDASAIKDNPAGLGIYRRSELTGTFNTLMQSSTASWNKGSSVDDLFKNGFNNFSYVIALPTRNAENGNKGLLSSNFSISFNRLKNFDKSMYIKGSSQTSSMTDYLAGLTNGLSLSDIKGTDSYNPFNNINVPWLSILAVEGDLISPVSGINQWSSILNIGETVTPTYKLFEKGHLDEYSFGWAGNFDNELFLGASLNMKSLSYSAFSTYSETFYGTGNNDGGSMSLKDTIITKGSGINLKLGAIYCPTDYLRLGVSVHTPAILILTDNYYSELDFNTINRGYITTPRDGYSNYQIQSPFQFNASAAFIAGEKGLISIEYDFANYNGMRLRSDIGDAQSFDLENTAIRTNINNVNTIKVGGEYKLTKNFAVRAGYANSGASTLLNAAKEIRSNTLRTDLEYFRNNRTDYFTAGLGYREANWYIDCAFMNKRLDETFYPYNSNNIAAKNPTLAVAPASIITTNNNIVVTLGFKF